MRLSIVLLAAVAPLAAQSVKLPPVEKFTAPNGAVVLTASGGDVPLVTVRVMARGGAESDPAGKPGLAALMSGLLRRGAGARSAAQIEEALDTLGARLSDGSSTQTVELNLEFMAKDAPQALAILADLVARPTFPADEVKKQLAQAVDRARAARDNPGAAIGLFFRPFYFGSAHPYGRVGDETTLATITRDDIVGAHKRLFTGRNMIIAAAGQFDAAVLKPLLTKLASEVPAGDAYAWAAPAAPTFKEPRLLLVDKPDATQTYFTVAMPGVDHKNPDRVALRLVNTLFGGRFTSMLNDALRVKSGLTYGARSVVELNRLPGAIYISTYTKTEATAQAIDMALDVLKKLRTTGIDAEMLASVKAYVKGEFPTQELETSGQLVRSIGDIELYDQTADEINQFYSRIDAVTLAQANAVAKKYYTDANLQFCLVGNASKIKADVAKYAAKQKVLDIKTPRLAEAGGW